MASLAAATAAKDDLRRKLQGQPWLRGIGIMQAKCMGSDPYEIQVNVDSARTVDALRSCPQTPRKWMGVPIQFVAVGNITAFGATDITTQDYANVALGAIIATATFLMGKIAIESAITARKEHFDAKGQPPAAVKAKETTFDGIMKVAVTCFSLWQIKEELPALLDEAKKYLK